jgi:hypothetical protein
VRAAITGAREQRDDVGATGEGAPRLRAGDRPAGDAVDRRGLGATREATSEPVSGSVTEIATIVSPEASLGRSACFCASVPPASKAFARISGRVISEPAAASETRDSSSVVTIIARLPSSWPPKCAGIDRPK